MALDLDFLCLSEQRLLQPAHDGVPLPEGPVLPVLCVPLQTLDVSAGLGDPVQLQNLPPQQRLQTLRHRETVRPEAGRRTRAAPVVLQRWCPRCWTGRSTAGPGLGPCPGAAAGDDGSAPPSAPRTGTFGPQPAAGGTDTRSEGPLGKNRFLFWTVRLTSRVRSLSVIL